MAHETRKKNLLKKHGLSGVNKPKRTPNHKTKSHVVLAQQGHEMKLIRFGQQGANIHKKRKRIKEGSKEKMRKPGSKGAPTAKAFKKAAKTAKKKTRR